MQIPTVDLEDLAGARPREEAAAAIREGFGTFGLLYVRNHGIDQEALEALFALYAELTTWSEERKRALSGDDVWFQRGWTPPNTERAVVAGGQPDFKECYFAAPVPGDPTCKIHYPQIYADNLWPDDLPGFSSRYEEVGRALQTAGEVLLRGAALALGLEEGAFVELVQGGPHVFRLLRYLPLDDEQIAAGVLWGEEHTDFNLLTLLPGGRFLDPAGARCPRPDDHSGLHLRTRPTAEHPRGQKVRGVAPPGCIVVQVGQQLEILTGGTFLATPHVVTAPKTPGFSRLSAAHFVHLHSHQRVFPLAPFQTPEALAAYSPPVLAGTYSIKTLVDIGLAPPSAIDKLGYRHYDRLAAMRQPDGSGGEA